MLIIPQDSRTEWQLTCAMFQLFRDLDERVAWPYGTLTNVLPARAAARQTTDYSKHEYGRKLQELAHVKEPRRPLDFEAMCALYLHAFQQLFSDELRDRNQRVVFGEYPAELLPQSLAGVRQVDEAVALARTAWDCRRTNCALLLLFYAIERVRSGAVKPTSEVDAPFFVDVLLLLFEVWPFTRSAVFAMLDGADPKAFDIYGEM